MQCRSCKSTQTDDTGTCLVCGSVAVDIPSQVRTCSNCGFLNQQQVRFCGGCGRPVITLAGAAKSAAAYVQSPLPKSLVERLSRSGTAMLGERKRVTILFADIRGSTEMVDRMDVERALEVLGPVVKVMMDAVHQHDGFVNRTVGDGIMALFGAPLANEDHAVLACQAAIAMRAAAQAITQKVGEAIDLRIGLHSGDVLIHAIGNDLSMSFDAIGRAVHVAARMETSAVPGTICLTADTYALARHCVEVEPASAISLKGFASPI